MSNTVEGIFNIYHANNKVIKYLNDLSGFEDEFGWIPSRPVLGKEVAFEMSIKPGNEISRISFTGEGPAAETVLAKFQTKIGKLQHPMVTDQFLKDKDAGTTSLTRWVNGHESDHVAGGSDFKQFSADSLAKSTELLPELRPITMDDDDGFDDFD